MCPYSVFSFVGPSFLCHSWGFLENCTILCFASVYLAPFLVDEICCIYLEMIRKPQWRSTSCWHRGFLASLLGSLGLWGQSEALPEIKLTWLPSLGLRFMTSRCVVLRVNFHCSVDCQQSGGTCHRQFGDLRLLYFKSEFPDHFPSSKEIEKPHQKTWGWMN